MSRRRDAIVVPVLTLADKLAARGQRGMRGVLRAAVTYPSELVSENLVETVASIAESQALREDLREEAHALLALGRDPAQAIGRCGIVYVVWSEGWQSQDPLADTRQDPVR